MSRMKAAMQRWRRPTTIILAMVAFFASLLPAPSWACPITGRIGDATLVCAQMSPHCARAFSKCCHPVSMPPQSANATRAPAALWLKAALFTPESPDQPTLPLVDGFFVVPNSQLRPALLSIMARGAPPSPSHLQIGSPTVSGRAPPFSG